MTNTTKRNKGTDGLPMSLNPEVARMLTERMRTEEFYTHQAITPSQMIKILLIHETKL